MTETKNNQVKGEQELVPQRIKRTSSEDQWKDLKSNFFIMWINEQPEGNIKNMLDKGFVFVLKDTPEGKQKVKERAGTSESGKEYYRYLMKQPLEYRQLDVEEINKKSNLPYENIMRESREYQEGKSKSLNEVIANSTPEEIESLKKLLGLNQR